MNIFLLVVVFLIVWYQPLGFNYEHRLRLVERANLILWFDNIIRPSLLSTRLDNILLKAQEVAVPILFTIELGYNSFENLANKPADNRLKLINFTLPTVLLLFLLQLLEELWSQGVNLTRLISKDLIYLSRKIRFTTLLSKSVLVSLIFKRHEQLERLLI